MLRSEVLTQVQHKDRLDPSKRTKLVAYGGDEIPSARSVHLSCQLAQQPYNNLCMGLFTFSKEVHQLHLKKDPEFSCQVFKAYKDEVGTLRITYKMTLNPEAQPVVRPVCRLPVAMRDKVKVELDRMTSLGVITPFRSLWQPTTKAKTFWPYARSYKVDGLNMRSTSQPAYASTSYSEMYWQLRMALS